MGGRESKHNFRLAVQVRQLRLNHGSGLLRNHGDGGTDTDFTWQALIYMRYAKSVRKAYWVINVNTQDGMVAISK